MKENIYNHLYGAPHYKVSPEPLSDLLTRTHTYTLNTSFHYCGL